MKIKTGRMAKPDRIVLTGTEGVGKTTFAADAPSPVFIAAEDGIGHLDVHSFDEPKAVMDVFDALRSLRGEPHEYKTLVVDTVDWLEPIILKEVCERNKWHDIEAPGYGKGYAAALDEWRKLIADFDALRAERGMEIILIAHTQVKLFSNPAGPDYNRYEMKLHRGASALLREWADSVLFACYEEAADKKTKKGISTGHRVIHTERRSAWDAKNRHGLPEMLSLSYEEYAAARSGPDVEALAVEFDDLLARLNPPKDLKKKIVAFVGKRDDPSRLAQSIDRLRALITEA